MRRLVHNLPLASSPTQQPSLNTRFIGPGLAHWMSPFLAAILNSETVRARTEEFQARGQFGARHFDKVVFTLPIARFEAGNALHQNLAAAAREAEAVAAAVALPEGVRFQRARKLVRDALTEAGVAPRIDALVARLLDRS
jgi:hypothetical protein